MALMYDENKVTMTLGQFLTYRDALKFQEEIKAFALDSKADYSENRRDVHEIGYRVLAILDIPVKREEDNDEN